MSRLRRVNDETALNWDTTLSGSDLQAGFNERSNTRFNHLPYPADVVCLVVLWRVRYKVSLRDLPEMFLEGGVVFTQEAVRE